MAVAARRSIQRRLWRCPLLYARPVEATSGNPSPEILRRDHKQDDCAYD